MSAHSTELTSKGKGITLQNSSLSRDQTDILYHLGLTQGVHDLVALFGDTKFVLMGGSADRSRHVAYAVSEALSIPVPEEGINPIGKTERFSLYKVGPVISVNHGMGMPSLSILLHEITKLLFYAKAEDVIYIRIGTSGGLGVAPGTAVVTTGGVNGKIQPIFKQTVLGKSVKYDASYDENLAKEVFELASVEPPIPAALGKTLSVNDFYEEQARLDGAVVEEYTETERNEYLEKLYAAGVRNIEMEALLLGAFCNRLKIPAITVCAALLNRLNSADQVVSTPAELASYSANAQALAIRFVKHKLGLPL